MPFMYNVDLCVIGSGPAGQKCAIQAAKLRKSAVIVEKREVVGGVAINTGTIPSKAFREAILNLAGRTSAMPKIEDFRAVQDATFDTLTTACNTIVRTEVDLVARHFRSNGIDVLHGIARFVGPNTVEVTQSNGRTQTVEAKNIFVGVGTHPVRPAGMPFDGYNVITSDMVLKLPYMPRSMIVVGGGVIGTEYASMLAALGIRVTLIESRPRILDFVDGELIEALQYHFRQSGMTLRLGEKVVSIEIIDAPAQARSGNREMGQVTLESGKTLRADCVLYCVGRQGATAELNLESAGLSADSRGRLAVNENYQTSVPHIYAGGDVVGFPSLASVSMEQGRISACRMFDKQSRVLPELFPYGIYAIPEISMVGWTECQLTEKGIPYEAGIAQYTEIARGQLLNDTIGMLKLLIHQDNHSILGVHAIGTGATELIHIGQAAIFGKATAEYFVDTVFNYPTLAECYKVAALNGLNKLGNV